MLELLRTEDQYLGPYFNPQVVGLDLGVSFSLNDFIEDTLQPTTFKITLASNSCLKLLFLILRFIINKSYLC